MGGSDRAENGLITEILNFAGSGINWERKGGRKAALGDMYKIC